MNKQPQIYYYDQKSFKKHQDKIVSLQQKEKQLLEQLNNLDKHYIDNIIIPASVARAEQELEVVRTELNRIRNMQIVVVKSTEKSDTINIGNTYRAHVTLYDGTELDQIFELRAAYPEVGVPGKVNCITIDSGIGKAIIGKKIGEVCSFTIKGNTNHVVVLEEINNTNSTTPEEME